MSGVALSVIIPCRNDAAALAETLPALAAGLLPEDEIIVALAAPDAAVSGVGERSGARVVLAEKPGRGPQMNAGARAARGDVFVFNHADSPLTAVHLAALRAHLADGAAQAGAFCKDLRANDSAWAWAEPLVRWWTRRHGIVYGDQTMFMTRACFARLGGFREIPLMEDVALSPHLRRVPGFRLLDPPLRSSLRRFAGRNRALLLLRNRFYILCFRCGVPAERIFRWYYGRAP